MQHATGSFVVAADVGNSSTKYLLGHLHPSEDADRTLEIRLAWDACRNHDFRYPFDGMEVPEQAHWFVSSVNDTNAEALRQALVESVGIASWTNIGREQIPIDVQLDQPETVGIDRLLAAFAAKEQDACKGRDVIVIDCGTALTIDLVTSEGVYLGGVIMAGPAANLLALSQMTFALPDFSERQIVRPENPVGSSTEQAMLSGAYYQGLGAIERVVTEIRATTGTDPVTIGTGGGLGPWRDALPKEWMVVDNLVLEGILRIASRSFNS